MRWPRGADEDGSSLLSTVFGVLMFLTMLLFSVQVTTHLHATTVVTTAAFDAARLVSGAAVIDQDGPGNVGCGLPTEVEVARADAHLANLLGALWVGGESSDWTATTPGEVVLTVSVQTPARVVGGVGVVAGLDRIERTIRLTRECVR